MLTLVFFNLILLAVIALGLWLAKKFIRSRRAERILFLAAALFTILCHYSSLIYRVTVSGGAMEYLRQNPNLILPIYPCNVVMWSCVILPFCRKGSRLYAFFADYVFWFGIFSTLVGMFANVDFIREPTLANFEVTKSIVAHATLLFNVLLLPLFGHIRVELWRNLRHMAIAIAEMLVIGLYCNLVFGVLVSEARAYDINSMFLIHSPFDGLTFLTYPVIAAIALPLYFGLFALLEVFFYGKGERFYDRIAKTRSGR
ncbi:MAG: YwaF family protein [Clostridia bacterium]|nr:YwaF family protein [Clostridia bacterium]